MVRQQSAVELFLVEAVDQFDLPPDEIRVIQRFLGVEVLDTKSYLETDLVKVDFK